jgi:Tfp pilus assembly protein PilX
VISVGCALLLLIALLSHEPSQEVLTKKRMRAWRRDRLRLPHGNRWLN